MSISIENAFVKQFEADVHLAYQQTGTKLRGMIRSKNGIIRGRHDPSKVGRGTIGAYIVRTDRQFSIVIARVAIRNQEIRTG